MYWVLNRPQLEQVDFVYATDVSGGRQLFRSGQCPECGRTNLVERVKDISIELYGNSLGGFVWTDSANIVVEDHLAEVLRATEMTGFGTGGVNVQAWWRSESPGQPIDDWLDRIAPPTLTLLTVHGRAGALAPGDSRERTCLACGRLPQALLTRGFSVDPERWDGSDIFYVDEFPAIPIVGERFCEVLEQQGLENYSIVRVEEFQP